MNVQAMRVRLSAWRTELSYIIGLLIFVGIIEAIVLVLNPQLSGFWLGFVGLVLALIPAAIWLAVFYSVDRLEPEPKQYVIGVGILGALLAATIGQPLINGYFKVPEWIGTDTTTQILGSILIIGFIEAFLIYAAVRFSIFYSSEFDQRIDGVVYGSAAGLGYATMLNLITVVSNGGVDLGAGVIRIVVTQMVHGALGALLGYFLGRDKFDRERVWWMSAGVLLAAVLYGLYSWLSGEVTQAGINLSDSIGGYNPWPSLILGTVFAIVVLGATFTLVSRDLRADIGTPSSTVTTTTTTTTTSTPI